MHRPECNKVLQVLFYGERQRRPESSAAAVREFETAAMGLRDVASDAQPKAHAGMPARARCVGSLKWVHHPSELRCRDAGAVIFYRHTGPVWIGGERDRRVAAIFDGVIDQILDGPCQMIMHGVDYQAAPGLQHSFVDAMGRVISVDLFAGSRLFACGSQASRGTGRWFVSIFLL